MAADGKKQVPLRLSPKLYAAIAAWAEDDFRSVNGQIEYLLTECVRQRKKNGKYVSDEIDVPPELDIKSNTSPAGKIRPGSFCCVQASSAAPRLISGISSLLMMESISSSLAHSSGVNRSRIRSVTTWT